MLNQKQVEALAKCLEEQELKQHVESWLGFTWADVHVQPVILNQLVTEGFLDVTYNSRKYTAYQIVDREAAKSVAVAESKPEIPDYDPTSPLELPTSLFDIIVGQDQAKNISLMALQAIEPVHVLYVGAPGTAKSLFLEEISRIRFSRYMIGGNSTRAGITDFLLDVKPRVLAIDELEKANQNDMDVLLALMESGKVTRIKHQMREEVTLRTWVFAGANSLRYISAPLKDRFITRHFEPYSQTDFEAIARSILVTREKIDPEWVDPIVNGLRGHTLSLRDVVKVARMSQSRQAIPGVINAIFS